MQNWTFLRHIQLKLQRFTSSDLKSTSDTTQDIEGEYAQHNVYGAGDQDSGAEAAILFWLLGSNSWHVPCSGLLGSLRLK